MNDATLLGLKPRAIEIFNALVAAYLESGQPIGSKTLAQRLRLDLSPASIRSNMSDLEAAGLLFSPHISAGRVPTETGLRMFVDGLMEYSSDLTDEDRMSIDGECAMRGISVDDLLEKTTRTLSGLSRCASLCCPRKAMPNCSISNSCRLARIGPWRYWCGWMAVLRTA